MQLVIENLSKFFGAVRALDGVSMSAEGGDGLAVLGANGAGKSTLLNCIAGISRPESGRIELPADAKIGYLGHKTFLYGEMTVEANLHFWGRLGAVKNYKARANDLMGQTGLDDRAKDKVRILSAGMQKRAALCRAMMNEPDVLILDEPYSAFDQSGVSFLKKIIADIRHSGGIVLMATHFLDDAASDCTKFALLNRGRLEIFKAFESADIKLLQKKMSSAQEVL